MNNEGRKAHLVGSGIANLDGTGMPPAAVNAETKFRSARACASSHDELPLRSKSKMLRRRAKGDSDEEL